MIHVPTLVRNCAAVALLCLLQACSSEPPTTPTSGQILVHVLTRGTSLDADGYTLVVDTDSSRLVAPTAELTLTGIAPGAHQLALKGLAPNCTMSGSPVEVVVTAGVTAGVTLTVDCVAPTGRLVVRTVTSGAEDDPDGYTVQVSRWGEFPAETVDEVVLGNIPVGDVTVSLTNVAFNCAVQNQAVQTATISLASTVEVDFFVKCLAKVGTVVVKTITTGSDLDADGYAINFRYQTQTHAGVNDTLVYADLRIDGGQVFFSIRGIAHNCTVTSSAGRFIQPVFQSTVVLAFTVACAPTVGPYSTLAFQKNGPGGINRTYTIRSDGQQVQRLGDDALPLFDPVWSPDGTRIAATGGGQLYVMDADGQNRRQLTTSGGTSPSWSPDGTRLLFLRPAFPGGSLFVMNADGSNPSRITQRTDFSEPSFSPDGQRILFVDNCITSCRIVDMKADGTDVRILSDVRNETSPSYSPDGSKILFGSDRSGGNHMYEMDADGSNVRILEFLGSTKWARYSPDGSRIAYSTFFDNGYEIFIVNTDGTAPVRVTSDAGYNFYPRWKP